jgi:hypothetical protein
MAGKPKNKEQGNPGGQVVLDVRFRKYASVAAPFVDHDDYATLGTLPTVEIYNPSGTLVTSSANVGQPSPIRLSQGNYEYTRAIGVDDEISLDWTIVWKLTINGNELSFSECFGVVAPGDAEFGSEEFRIGYAFNNPNLTSDRYYPGWGIIVHPDELRYLVGFGNKLVSPDANQTYDDNMLYYYIDYALTMIEKDLRIDILPRIVHHKDLRNSTSGEIIPRTDIPEADQEIINGFTVEQKAKLYFREDGYPYRNQNANNYSYIKLRRRPLREVNKSVLRDPLGEGTVLNLLPWLRETLGYEAKLQFYPDAQSIAAFPYIPRDLFRVNFPYNHFPDAYLIDYKTGYLNAAEVPHDIRTAIMWLAGIWFLEDLSDGRAPGLASASANLNSISESYSTTQSATNSLFGARIAYYKTHMKNWMESNQYSYKRNFIGVL